MRRPRLLPEITESGPLVQLIEIQTGLSWDILTVSRLASPLPAQPF